ncbi:hypothetical protein HCN44_000791 [Aphidius gifuensis]|uniref:Uncharacterized protein n=1 Tax=Aphidius gifuensis TaxID=684658 RepID=A0A834XQD7_APHGI|nr:hypothetical protein HCN44_000791 [Aphidius gifuensis]
MNKYAKIIGCSCEFNGIGRYLLKTEPANKLAKIYSHAKSIKWNDDFKKQVRNICIRTTKILINAVHNSDVKYFRQISGVVHYLPDAAGELPKDSKTRKVVIRSGVVLGRVGGIIPQIFFPFYLSFGGPIGSGNQYMPYGFIFLI